MNTRLICGIEGDQHRKKHVARRKDSDYVLDQGHTLLTRYLREPSADSSEREIHSPARPPNNTLQRTPKDLAAELGR